MSTSRQLTFEDLWSLERPAAPALAPDGRRVAFTVTRYSHEDNKGHTHLWLAATDGGEPYRLTWGRGNDKKPVWSPDGRHLAFVSRRGADKPAQLHRLPMDGPGEAEPLTDLPIAVLDFRWRADSRRIAFVASTFPGLDDDFKKVEARLKEQKDDKTKARISDRRLLRYWDQYRTDGRVPHFFELDLESREIRDLTPGFDALVVFRVLQWDLAPGGDEIAFMANSTDPPWQQLHLDLHLLDVASGRIENLTRGQNVSTARPRYSPDGRYLFFGRAHRPRISADFSRLTRYDRTSGEMVDILGDWDFEPDAWRVTGDSRSLVFHVQNRGRQDLYSVSTDGPAPLVPRLLVEGGATSQVTTSEDGFLVFMIESAAEPAQVATLGDDGHIRRLTAWNRERLDEIDLGEIENVTFEGAGDDDVQMWIVRPPDFDPERRWPLVLLLHGGPHSAWLDSWHYRWNMALFAARGYVVAALNFHGSTGFGQAFCESIIGEPAEKPFEDVMKATDLLLARGDIDPARMAVAGGSYGGFLVSWILGHTDRYAAAVNHAGVYDLMAQFASDFTWNRDVQYGAAPWVDPETIDLQSPSRFARAFTTPTLILHGELDYRVPVTQGITLHHVLTGKGVPSRIVIFPKENHWILRPQSAALWWREVSDWLEKYIGTGPSA